MSVDIRVGCAHQKDNGGFMGNHRIIVSLGVVMMFVVGCVPQYLAPVPSNIQNEKIYNVSYDKLWAASVKIFADRVWDIKTIEKASGIIVGESTYDFGLTMDCGSFIYPAAGDKKGEKVKNLTEVILKYNFYIQNLSENQTSLKINLSGTGHIITLIDPFAPPVKNILNCVSTGELEQSIFKQIENNLSSR